VFLGKKTTPNKPKTTNKNDKKEDRGAITPKLPVHIFLHLSFDSGSNNN
jgi:hypothetical protein